jgi:hypothetical protein
MKSVLTVRPFERMIDGEAGPQSLRCCGSIEGTEYGLKVGGGTHRLPTVSTGLDEWGPFAIVDPCDVALGSGLQLTIEVEPEDPEPGSPLGCRIALTTLRDPAITAQLLRSRGIDPESVTLLVQPEAAVAVRFLESGHFRGCTHLWTSEGNRVPSSG